MMASVLTPKQALALRDKEGHGLEELRAQAGFAGPLESVALPKGRFHQFLELHIEQGPYLEEEGLDVGLVTHIAAPASQRIVIEGEGGHAGGKLMPGRKDALAAAAELILALEAAAKSTGAIDTVGTVGVCEVFPGAVNSIPSRVLITTDIRDIDRARRDGVLTALAAATEDVSAHRGVTITTHHLRPRDSGGARSLGNRSRQNIQEDGCPRLPRLIFCLLHRANGHAVHSMPGRSEPQARRIRLAGVDRQRRTCAGADTGQAGRITHPL
jgi:acetylornithine deacetylase/succinyl-diaminopimelate desuccinylase-like protein